MRMRRAWIVREWRVPPLNIRWHCFLRFLFAGYLAVARFEVPGGWIKVRSLIVRINDRIIETSFWNEWNIAYW